MEIIQTEGSMLTDLCPLSRTFGDCTSPNGTRDTLRVSGNHSREIEIRKLFIII